GRDRAGHQALGARGGPRRDRGPRRSVRIPSAPSPPAKGRRRIHPPPAPDRMARKQHHIIRIDIEPTDKYPKRHPTHGWQVRVRRDGRRLSKFFADARHDGREGALEAAVLYRDHLLEHLPEPDARPRKSWSNT